MHVFIFQSLLERYDLRAKINVGETDTWHATRYRSEMKIGDLVYFWMGGPDATRGLYGWGAVASPPYMKPTWTSYGVDVSYRCKFMRHVPARALHDNPILGRMLIFRAPQASNFLLSDEEARTLAAEIEARGEVAAHEYLP